MIGRLTEKTDEGIWVKESHGENVMKTLYQCYGAESLPDYSNCDEGYCAMEKLAEYETAEEEGRLVRLPCKVGQEMFFPDIIKGIIPLLVSEIWVQESDIKITVKYNGDDDDFKYWRTRFSVLNPDEIGRKFFFGRGEAEEALKEMKKNE